VTSRILLTLGCLALAAGPAPAGTFERAPLAPDLGLDALTRRVTREQLGRDLFGDPWAAVTLSHVDVYDRFPYVESRHFVIVSDPAWHRLVHGEVGGTLRAWDGAGGALGALDSPRGLAVDDRDRVYVADAGAGRVLVLQATSTFGELALTPLHAISGLAGPQGVAWSDGGTPFAPGDDVLFVAEAGANRVSAYALADGSARRVAALGGLGSGTGRFAGPLAVCVGRDAGSSTTDVYVADAHNRRLVRLGFSGGRLEWRGEVPSGADAIPSLATDEWGNVYAAAPQQGMVRKFSARLEPVAELAGGGSRPRSLHVPFFTVRDHRDGRTVRAGQPAALVLGDWDDASGLSRFDLGVSVEGLVVTGGAAPEASLTLTDRARLSLEVRERVPAGRGRTLARRDAGTHDAGHVRVALAPGDLAMARDGAELELVAVATPLYEGGAASRATAAFRSQGGGLPPPAAAAVLPAWPNPTRDASRLRFAVPAGAAARLALHDAGGRLVRRFAGPFAPGVNEVLWDGRDEAGRAVRSGLYFFQLDAGGTRLTRRLMVVR
jgi:hypothetical protein